MNAEESRTLTAPDERPLRYGSAMLRRFGWFYQVLGLGWMLSRVRFEEHSVDRIRHAAAEGPLVYVLLSRSTLDHLALNTVLNRRRLPLSVWSNGTTSFPWQPVAEAWRDVFSRWSSRLRAGRRPDPVRSGWLARAVAEGSTVTIFLQDGSEGPAPEDDPLRALLDAQAHSPRPVQLVPVICVWDRAPEHAASLAAQEFLLGSRETPSLLTKLANLLTPGDQPPFLQVGEPLDLAAFVARASPERRLDSLRTLLRRYLRREGRVVRGPRLLPPAQLRSVVLEAPPMRRFAAEEAERLGVSPDEVRRRMAKEFDAIAANFSWPLIRFLSYAMRPIWNRVYSGYDIREEDLDRIRTAVREGTAVLVPCHKSHFDYLLMSWVLYWHDLIVPHVVAGINLAMPGVHRLLRGAGGFFIRRGGFASDRDRIHPKVFARYLRELLLHGYTVEFFIEGGRTRSGKLLTPKTGVLGMIVDAADTAPPGHEITLLPVAIAYEQVAEEGAYRAELAGKAKQSESVGDLIKARSVLRRRFGRIFVRVGEPVKASEILRDGWRDLPEAEQRELLRRLGDRLVHRVGEAMVVLPTALVAMGLLAHHRQGIRHDALVERLQRFRDLLRRAGAEESAALERFEAAVPQALDRFLRDGRIRRLGDGVDRIWDIVPDQRTILDFHKNQILHYVSLPALAAAVVHGLAHEPFGTADLEEPFCWLLKLMRREFVFDPDAPPEARLAEALGELEAHGALARDGEGWRVVDEARIAEVHGLVRALLESYLLVLEASRRLEDRALDKKALEAEVRGAAEAWLKSGVATRPEAFSTVSVQNAIGAFLEQGILVRDGDRLRLERERAEATVARLAPMVRP